MTPRPRPITGALLGLLLGIVVLGLLWQGGMVPPDRLPVFLILAATILATAGLLTRSVSAARARFVTVAVIAGILTGVGLTGIPETFRTGAVSEGCTLQATAGGLVATPADTSIVSRFTVTADEAVQWSATAATPIAVTERQAGLTLAGFDVPVRTVTVTGAEPVEALSGSLDVAGALTWIEDRTSLEVSGVYHLFGSVTGDEGACAFEGYAVLMPESPWATNTLIGLWIALGVLLLLTAWGAFAVRSSFVKARRAAEEASRFHTGTISTAAVAAGVTRGHVAADVEASSTTSWDDATVPPADAVVEPASGDLDDDTREVDVRTVREEGAADDEAEVEVADEAEAAPETEAADASSTDDAEATDEPEATDASSTDDAEATDEPEATDASSTEEDAPRA
ncbi:hypothetical protein [Demequina pelophila]|uniref:hypothetical protein n=1 Tax=Demequina pelophila TaxID=1638984 RepID=UPI0007805875|nr:hypothetical protein [Demequina pelophila]